VNTTQLTHLQQGALISGVYASAFSWYNVPPQPWSIKGSWYSGLLFALVSICIATQQSVALHRLSSNEDALIRLCSIFSYNNAGILKPRYTQIYIWQAPVMLLNLSIALFLLGLVVLVYNEEDVTVSALHVCRRISTDYPRL
jgi:hypothetical protein